MRLLFAAFAIATLVPGAARASSFANVEPPKPGAAPSIIRVGAAVEPANTIASMFKTLMRLANPLPEGEPARLVHVSASIVSVADAYPAVTMEKVSAIGQRRTLPEPMVMRGGVSGGAFSTPDVAPNVASVPDKPAQGKTEQDKTIPSAAREGGNDAAPASGEPVAEKRPAPPPSAPAASRQPAPQPSAQSEGPTPQ